MLLMLALLKSLNYKSLFFETLIIRDRAKDFTIIRLKNKIFRY